MSGWAKILVPEIILAGVFYSICSVLFPRSFNITSSHTSGSLYFNAPFCDITQVSIALSTLSYNSHHLQECLLHRHICNCRSTHHNHLYNGAQPTARVPFTGNTEYCTLHPYFDDERQSLSYWPGESPPSLGPASHHMDYRCPASTEIPINEHLPPDSLS